MSPERIDAKESEYLYLKTSQIPLAGKGLFVSIPIYKNEIVALFKGEIIHAKEAKIRADRGQDDYFINCLDGTIMDSMHVKCFAKYANDPNAYGVTISKTPFKTNTEISMDDDDNICLVASRNIKAGEEIFCSYGKKYWQNFNRRLKQKVTH